MANKYSQTFTLLDIFNNKKLAGKLPLVNYKEKEIGDGKVQVRTAPKSIGKLVYDISVKTARPFYSPFSPSKSGNTIILNGNMLQEDSFVVESVYNALVSSKTLMTWTVNNTDMIRDALKEAEKNKREFGINSKLYLRANSMQQIEGLSRPQIQALLTDIMDNLFYNDNFTKTQKKYGVDKLKVKSPYTYSQRKQSWKIKVGDV